MVLVSVITPTLNAAAFLNDCLKSVVAQDGVDLEHIVVDGGSTDDTRDLVQRFPGVRYLERSGTNQTQAINIGVRAARGAVVAWLNSDDQYLPGALRLVVDRFAADATLDVLYGDCRVIDTTGRLLWTQRPGAYDFRRLLRTGNYIAQPSVFLRRRVFDQVGYLDESFECGMDYELWLRVRACRIQYVASALASFRWHPSSKTARSQFVCWRELMRAVRRHGGRWTLALGWSFGRMLLTVTRKRTAQNLRASARRLRDLVRG